MSSEPGYSRQSSMRFTFRVAAVVVLGLACYFMMVGLADLFTAESEPEKFWMLFVGVPMLAVGGWLAMAGFGGAAARYAVGEAAPVARDSLDYLTRRAPGDEPTGGPYCRSCGTRNDATASYCDSCGTSLA